MFLRRQATLAHPLMDLGLLARPRVRRTLTALFLTALLMGGTSLFFNLYLQEVQGLSPLDAAWWMLPMMVSMIAAANLGPWLNRRLSQRTVVVSMMSVMTVGFALYVVAPVSSAGTPGRRDRRQPGHLRDRRRLPDADGRRDRARLRRSAPPRARPWPSCPTSSVSPSA